MSQHYGQFRHVWDVGWHNVIHEARRAPFRGLQAGVPHGRALPNPPQHLAEGAFLSRTSEVRHAGVPRGIDLRSTEGDTVHILCNLPHHGNCCSG